MRLRLDLRPRHGTNDSARLRSHALINLEGSGSVFMKPKRTKKYKPREILADPVSWAIAGSHLLPRESVAAAFVPIDAALLILKQGRALRDDWNMVAQALNVAEALAELQVGHNLVAEIAAGQAALMAIAQRMLKGSATCYASELADVDEALFVYRAQLKVCTQADFGKAVKRVRQLHACGAMQDVERVFEGMPRAA